jgi:hypothetical protein
MDQNYLEFLVDILHAFVILFSFFDEYLSFYDSSLKYLLNKVKRSFLMTNKIHIQIKVPFEE